MCVCVCLCVVTKSHLTLCDPMDCSPLGSSVRGISQARIMEWVAISFCRGSSHHGDRTCISCIAGGLFTEPPGKTPEKTLLLLLLSRFSRVQLFVTPRTVAQQASLPMEFFRQEHWSGLPFPSAGDLPNPRTEPESPAWQADSLPSEPPGKPPAEQ